LKLSIFVCTINPEYWCFPYLEALESYCAYADEVIVIDSGSTDESLEQIKRFNDNGHPYQGKVKLLYSKWPWKFTQREYPIHYNQGFDACSGDWVLKMDIDHILHENYAKELRHRLSEASDNVQMATFQRWNFLNRTTYYDKGKMPTAIKKKFPIKVGVPLGETNTDWTVPIEVKEYHDGVPYGTRIDPSKILNTGIPIYNYDCFFRPKDKCKIWYQRIARANPSIYGLDDDDAWEHWKNIRLRQRDEAVLQTTSNHPIYIRQKLNSMTPDMWGCNNWGWKL